MMASIGAGPPTILNAGGPLLIALVTSLCCGPSVIRWLKSHCPERIASDSARLNELHAGKKNTPTMGGLLMVLSILVAVVTCGHLESAFSRLALVTTLALTLVGSYDDWIKLKTSRKGLTARGKLLAQSVIAVAAATVLHQLAQADAVDAGPLFQRHYALLESRWLYVPWAAFVIVGTSNAVNLTDGLDGLAAGCSFITTAALMLILSCTGSQFLSEPRIQEAVNLCAALAGAVLGFLRFNHHPARVFMGDAGSLPIGGLLAVIALACRMELILVIVGGVFVTETLSVIVQVLWYRRTGRRVLLCSPLHNHFVFRGDRESRIVGGFWFMAVICGVVGVMTCFIQ